MYKFSHFLPVRKLNDLTVHHHNFFSKIPSLGSDFTEFSSVRSCFSVALQKGQSVTEIPAGKRVGEVLRPSKDFSCTLLAYFPKRKGVDELFFKRSNDFVEM